MIEVRLESMINAAAAEKTVVQQPVMQVRRQAVCVAL